MSPLLETVGVILLAVLGAGLGRFFSRLPKPWWLLGYFIPLVIIVLVGLPRIERSLEFVPPISWLVSGRTLFAVAGMVTTMILVTPLSRLARKRDRQMVAGFVILFVGYASVWPFFAPVLNQRFQASIKTQIDKDGICQQSSDYNCGPAAAVTALRWLGFPAEEGEIAILSHTSTAIGTPPDVLCRALQKHYGARGLQCEYRHFKSIAELKNGGVTLIVTNVGLFSDHYLTVLKVTDNLIIVGDPSRGLRAISHDEFLKNWRFVGVVLKREGN
jgi:predicted double-glycine peptidase